MIIWFDFENAPHVWILKEFIEELQSENYELLITARDFSSTLKLCKYLNVPCTEISVNQSLKTKYGKLYSTISRGLKLKNYVLKMKEKPCLAISHGSRSQGFASYLMNVPVISLDDYEYSLKIFNYFVDRLLTPDKIPSNEWGLFSKKVTLYPGLKEELYLWNPNNYQKEEFNFLSNDKINIVFRPEGRFTHYSSKKSKRIQDQILDRFAYSKNILVILISRDKIQENEIENYFIKNHIDYIIPQNVLNGPALIYNADLVIGGGGTMTREASVLNTPAYTFFGGRLGHVDKYLIEQRKLTLLSSKDDLCKIKLEKKQLSNLNIRSKTFDYVYNYIKDNFLN